MSSRLTEAVLMRRLRLKKRVRVKVKVIRNESRCICIDL